MEGFESELLKRMKNPQLFPFYGLVALYYVLYLPFLDYPPVTLSAAFFKVLPIWSLAYFVRQTAATSKSAIFPDEYYPKFIMLGLLVSSLGDACLVSRHVLFIPGMFVFMSAHVCYLHAFGPSEVPDSRMKSLYALGALAVFLFISDDIDSYVMHFLVFCYAVLIFNVAWRAHARYEKEMTYSALFGSIGALIFTFSDLVIAVSKWKYHVPFEECIVLSTYYLAQFGIAISTQKTV